MAADRRHVKDAYLRFVTSDGVFRVSELFSFKKVIASFSK